MMGLCMKSQLRQNMQLLHPQLNPLLPKTSPHQSETSISLILAYQVSQPDSSEMFENCEYGLLVINFNYNYLFNQI